MAIFSLYLVYWLWQPERVPFKILCKDLLRVRSCIFWALSWASQRPRRTSTTCVAPVSLSTLCKEHQQWMFLDCFSPNQMGRNGIGWGWKNSFSFLNLRERKPEIPCLLRAWGTRKQWKGRHPEELPQLRQIVKTVPVLLQQSLQS